MSYITLTRLNTNTFEGRKVFSLEQIIIIIYLLSLQQLLLCSLISLKSIDIELNFTKFKNK